MRIVGVAGGVEDQGKEYLIDCWPEPEQGLSKKAIQSYILGSELVISRHERIQHYQRWELFQRVLRMTVNHGWPDQLVAALLALDHRDFARQQNDLHYELGWISDDLHAYVSPMEFRPNDVAELVAKLKPGVIDFSVTLGCAVLR